MMLCRQLWAAGISADLMYEHMTGVSVDRLMATCRSEGILFLVTVRPRHDVLKVRNVLHRAEEEVPMGSLVYWLQDRLAKQRMIDQQQLANMPALYSSPAAALLGGGLPASPAASTATNSFAMATSRAGDRNITCQVVMPALKYPGKEDRSGKNSRARNQPRSVKQLIIDKAARDAQRLAEDILVGRVPVIAVDMAARDMERLAYAILGSDVVGSAGAAKDAGFAAGATGAIKSFRAYLDTLPTPFERDYAKLIRSQLVAALNQVEHASQNHSATGHTSLAPDSGVPSNSSLHLLGGGASAVAAGGNLGASENGGLGSSPYYGGQAGAGTGAGAAPAFTGIGPAAERRAILYSVRDEKSVVVQ